MPDREIALDLLDQIGEACRKIVRRAGPLVSPEDFLASDDGQDRLDAIGMMIIVIGETLKKLDKYVLPQWFAKHPEIDWKAAKGMRDVLSHEYYVLEVATVFDVAKNKVPALAQAISDLERDLREAASS